MRARNTDGLTESLSLPGAIVFIGDHARDAYIAAQLAEVFNGRADIVGDIE